MKSNNKRYRAGSFDFVAAYAILEDTWYIVPEKVVRGLGAITLCSTMPKYEQYREGWHLLREPECEQAEETGNEAEETPAGPAFARMQAAMNSFRGYLERGKTAPKGA